MKNMLVWDIRSTVETSRLAGVDRASALGARCDLRGKTLIFFAVAEVNLADFGDELVLRNAQPVTQQFPKGLRQQRHPAYRPFQVENAVRLLRDIFFRLRRILLRVADFPVLLQVPEEIEHHRTPAGLANTAPPPTRRATREAFYAESGERRKWPDGITVPRAAEIVDMPPSAAAEPLSETRSEGFFCASIDNGGRLARSLLHRKQFRGPNPGWQSVEQ
ncbi:MAG TPA: hypothetical protein VHV55_15345 [Pirellulales bacterium]|jgi:hypothetical protein|nr:hypothetical protein [Pirellulales bacterium]